MKGSCPHIPARRATEDDYDEYFGICSAPVGTTEWHDRRGKTLASFIDDLSTSNLSDEALRTLLIGLGLGAEATGEPATDTEIVRWKRGHQIFDLLLDGINGTLAEALATDPIHHRDRMVDLLLRIAKQYRASTVSFSYAADFTPEAYESGVRPTMAPDEMPEAFSGSLNAKHRDMKRLLSSMTAKLFSALGKDKELWPPAIAEAFERVLDAKAENLSNHGRICEHFVPGGKSLLREYLTRVDG
jgi:hypothetical protein